MLNDRNAEMAERTRHSPYRRSVKGLFGWSAGTMLAIPAGTLVAAGTMITFCQPMMPPRRWRGLVRSWHIVIA